MAALSNKDRQLKAHYLTPLAPGLQPKADYGFPLKMSRREAFRRFLRSNQMMLELYPDSADLLSPTARRSSPPSAATSTPPGR